MTLISNIKNNTSLKDIIGEVTLRQDNTSKTIICNKKNTIVKERLYCSLSNTFIKEEDTHTLVYGFALNTHVLRYKQHPIFNLKRVPYISLDFLDICDETNAMFVFNIEELRKTRLLAMLLNIHMASELIDYMRVNFLDTELFPYQFGCEYKGKFPEIISNAQLKKLYELGMVKMGFVELYSGSIKIMSDEAFDHIYSNGRNDLQRKFKTKENMHDYIRKILDMLNF